MRPFAFLAFLLLAGCDNRIPATPVVVFAAGGDGTRLAAVLDEAAAHTGLDLDVRWGDSAELTQALIAKTGEPADVLITDNARGAKTAERLVRLWVRNLARPPFATEEALLQAVRDGACDYAIGGWTEHARGAVAFPVDQYSIDIEAVGIGRHARNADAAQEMVDWLLRNPVIEFKSQDDRYPAPVRIAGYRDEEARLLAERAGYR